MCGIALFQLYVQMYNENDVISLFTDVVILYIFANKHWNKRLISLVDSFLIVKLNFGQQKIVDFVCSSII